MRYVTAVVVALSGTLEMKVAAWVKPLGPVTCTSSLPKVAKSIPPRSE
jgi:hypothetical protein